MNHPSLEDTYNTIAEHFSETRSKPWKEFTEYASYIQPDDKILDIGCGNGRLYHALPAGVSYTGVDIAEELLAVGRKNIPEGTFIHASMTHLPFPNNSFDAVFAIASLQHLSRASERAQAVQEIYRVCKPGGTIIISNWDITHSKHKKSFSKIFFDWIISGGKIGRHDYLIPWKSPKGEILANRSYHNVSEQEIKKLFRIAHIIPIKIFHEFASKKNRNLCAIGRK